MKSQASTFSAQANPIFLPSEVRSKVQDGRIYNDGLNSGMDCSSEAPSGDATALLNAVGKGEPQSNERLLNFVYEELRRLAASKMAREVPGQTLQPTALVHEAWLRLVGAQDAKFENRAYFFSAAAEAMRRILIDRARRKLTRRHGGGSERVPVEECNIAAPEADDQLLAVHEALDKLALEHPLQSELVKLRYFVGMTNEEAAHLLGISVTTATNYWTFSRTWLFHEIKRSQIIGQPPFH